MDSSEGILALAAAVALIFVVLRLVTLKGIGLGEQLTGASEWSFSESWASTITVVGATLGTLLGSAAFPEEARNLSVGEFATLDLLFVTVVIIAPLVYNALGKSIKDPGGQEWIFVGYVGGFMLSCLLTIFAVVGQLLTVFVGVDEIEAAGNLSTEARLVFQLFILLSLAVVARYAWRTMGETVTQQLKPAATKPDQGLFTVANDQQLMPARRWPVL